MPASPYQSNAGEIPFMRKWLFRALLLSLLFHAGLVLAFRATKLERFTPTTDRLIPRAFTVSRLKVNPDLLKEETPPEEPASPKKTQETPLIEIPMDKPTAEPTLEE